MHPAGIRVDQLRKSLDICALELACQPVLENQSRNRILRSCGQILQNIGISREAGLCLLACGKVPIDKQDFLKLLGRIEVEALYSKHAVKLGNNTLSVGCVEVPVLFQFYPIPTLAFEAGVTMVKGLSCTPDEIRVENHTLGVGEMRPNDVMLSVGANYKAPFGLSVGLRYNQGMSNLAGNFDTKISTVMFSVAYLFTIVK